MRREVNVVTGEEIELPDAPPSGSPPNFPQLDADSLNAALTEQGSVFRALAEVLFSEINVLRTAAGLTLRTKTQFIAALKAQMRT